MLQICVQLLFKQLFIFLLKLEVMLEEELT